MIVVQEIFTHYWYVIQMKEHHIQYTYILNQQSVPVGSKDENYKVIVSFAITFIQSHKFNYPVNKYCYY